MQIGWLVKQPNPIVPAFNNKNLFDAITLPTSRYPLYIALYSYLFRIFLCLCGIKSRP